jgi:hypothetical protein
MANNFALRILLDASVKNSSTFFLAGFLALGLWSLVFEVWNLEFEIWFFWSSAFALCLLLSAYCLLLTAHRSLPFTPCQSQ